MKRESPGMTIRRSGTFIGQKLTFSDETAEKRQTASIHVYKKWEKDCEKILKILTKCVKL